MQILLTSGARVRLGQVIARERRENPDVVFRIWETTSGRYDDAKIALRLILDERAEDDEQTTCCDLPFVASREFLSMRGEPHIFCIITDENGFPAVVEFGN